MVVFCRSRSDVLPVLPTTSTPVLISNLNWSADEDKTYLVNSATTVCDVGASHYSHAHVANNSSTCITCIVTKLSYLNPRFYSFFRNLRNATLKKHSEGFVELSYLNNNLDYN